MLKKAKRTAVFVLVVAFVVLLCFALSDNYLLVSSALIIILLLGLLIWSLIRTKNIQDKVKADFRLKTFVNNLKRELDGASTVFIMGHKFSDLDSLGASYGLYYALRDKYSVKLVANKQNTLARPLVDFLRFSDSHCKIYNFEEIKDLIDDNSLLIVVDTHRPSIMDYVELYNRVKNVVVIDHHLKSSEFANKAKLFYMQTKASSVCEIVTAMFGVLNIKTLETVAATALLSGIMLDTKNFVMNTASSTFSAAAFLRRFRADPVLIKKMFSETVDVCKRKYEIVTSVSLYENFAFARTDTDDRYTRISTAQAADELLAINGVIASFVMCPSDGKINISARSYGDVDVEKIMSKIGGGGHKTAAACQVEGKTFEEIDNMLKCAIDEYKKER